MQGADFSVQITIEGEMGETGRVIDFHAIIGALRAWCGGLDRRILLPLRNPWLAVHRAGGAWYAEHGERRWSFPAGDVVTFDVVNVTHEVLARHCLQAVSVALRADPEAALLRSIDVAVSDVEGTAHRTEAWDAGPGPLQSEGRGHVHGVL
ncbi:MAG: hypothetical protein NVSMB65_16110 [Chloroflexota bacterium]